MSVCGVINELNEKFGEENDDITLSDIENVIEKLKGLEDKTGRDTSLSKFFRNAGENFRKNITNDAERAEKGKNCADSIYELSDIHFDTKFDRLSTQFQYYNLALDAGEISSEEYENYIEQIKGDMKACKKYYDSRAAYYQKKDEEEKLEEIEGKLEAFDEFKEFFDSYFTQKEEIDMSSEANEEKSNEQVSDETDIEAYVYSPEEFGYENETSWIEVPDDEPDEIEEVEVEISAQPEVEIETIDGEFEQKEPEKVDESHIIDYEIPENDGEFVGENPDENYMSDEEFYNLTHKGEIVEENNSEIEQELSKEPDEIEHEEESDIEKNVAEGDDDPINNEEPSEVSKRIIDMVKCKNITSSSDIKKAINDICTQMQAPKQKKIWGVKKKKTSLGNMDENLYMDIRRVFNKINSHSKYLDEPNADKFAERLFAGGKPQYIDGNLDNKTINEFSAGIHEYLEMSESEIFTDSERENFEKFVIQLYHLKKMSREETKDFGSTLSEDTFSQEETIKNAISRGDDKEEMKEYYNQIK